MSGECAEGCAAGRIETPCRLHQAEVSGTHEIVETDGPRQPVLKIPRDVMDKVEMSFGQFVGRRSGSWHLAVNALQFPLRHTYLLVRFRKMEWVRES
jgi:hypothetical protein